jgi:hypothetical protein
MSCGKTVREREREGDKKRKNTERGKIDKNEREENTERDKIHTEMFI